MKKEKRFGKEKIITLFIAFIMVFSVAGFVALSSFTPSSQKISYNGYTFLSTSQGFMTKINKRDILFAYLPKDIESIPMDDSVKNLLTGTKMVYFTSKSNSSYSQEIALVEYELGPLMNDLFNIYTPTAFNSENRYNITIITCSNATRFVPVMEFREGNETGFRIKDNCVIAESDSANGFYMLRDRLLYSMLGVI